MLKTHRSGNAQRQGAGPPVPMSEKDVYLSNFSFIGNTTLECFSKEFRAAGINLSSSEHTLLLLSDDNQFQSPEIHLAISNLRTNNSISLLTFTSVIRA